MKQEILRIQTPRITNDHLHLLDAFSLSILAREIVTVIAPSWNGKTLLASLLHGDISFRGAAWFNDTKVYSSFAKAAKNGEIFCLFKESLLVPGYSLARNISALFSAASHASTRESRMLRAYRIISRVDLPLHPADKADSLSVFEQQMLILSIALQHHPRLIVINDTAAAYSGAEMVHFMRILNQLKSEGIAVLYMCSHADDVTLISDRVLAVRNNRKIHTFHRDDIFTRKDIMDLYIDSSYTTPFTIPPNGREILRIKGLCCGNITGADLTLKKGEIVGIYLPDQSMAETFCLACAGRAPWRSGSLELSGRVVPWTELKKAVIFTPENFADTGIFEQMSIYSNVHLIHRVSREYNSSSVRHFLESAISEELGITAAQCYADASLQDIYTRIRIVLLRLLFARPEILIFNLPFSNMDYKATQIVHRFFSKYRHVGIPVIYTMTQRDPYRSYADRIEFIAGMYAEGLKTDDLYRQHEYQRGVKEENE